MFDAKHLREDMKAAVIRILASAWSKYAKHCFVWNLPLEAKKDNEYVFLSVLQNENPNIYHLVRREFSDQEIDEMVLSDRFPLSIRIQSINIQNLEALANIARKCTEFDNFGSRFAHLSIPEKEILADGILMLLTFHPATMMVLSTKGSASLQSLPVIN